MRHEVALTIFAVRSDGNFGLVLANERRDVAAGEAFDNPQLALTA